MTFLILWLFLVFFSPWPPQLQRTKLLNGPGDVESGPGTTIPQKKWLHFISPIFVQAFTLTFLAEWGDRSQLTTIVLAAREVSVAESLLFFCLLWVAHRGIRNKILLQEVSDSRLLPWCASCGLCQDLTGNALKLCVVLKLLLHDWDCTGISGNSCFVMQLTSVGVRYSVERCYRRDVSLLFVVIQF